MSKVRDISNLSNIIKTDASGNVTFVSGSTTLMSISSSGAVTSTGAIGGSNATTLVTTGSNTFTGQQYISNVVAPVNFTDTASLYTDGGLRVGKDAYVSGTLYLNDLTVYGTQSINYITSSQLDISDNIITVNTATPSIRFGGIAVRDSGSAGTGLTGSLLWDSQNNHWIYTNPSGSSYSGGMLISGPRNTGTMGDEQGTTLNAIMKGMGGDHITSSGIFEVSGSVGIGTSNPSQKLEVSGTDNNNLIMSTTTTGAGGTFRIQANEAASYLVSNNARPLYIQTNSSTVLTLSSTGVATFTNRINGVVGGTVYNTAGLWLQGSSSTDGIAIGGTGGGDKTIDTYGGTLRLNGTANNGLYVGGAATFSSDVTVGSPTTNATLSISGDNSGGDSFLNFKADLGGIKAQIQGTKYAGTGGILYFKTRQSDVLTTAMTINQSGYVTTPYQPFASMGLSTSFSSTGNNIIWQLVHHNIGNCYNSSTGIFTCPVAGTYLASIMCMTDGIDQTLDIEIRLNGARSNTLVPYQGATGGFYNQVSGMTMLALQANDTLAFMLNGGSIYGSSGGRHSAVVFALVR